MSQPAAAALAVKKYKKKSQLREIWRRLKKNRAAMLGLAIFAVIVFCTIFADCITPYEMALKQNAAERLQTSSFEHWFGTDRLGRDIFARVVHATRNSLIMGIGAVVVGVAFGSLFGSVAGFYGGKADSLIMRSMDTVICIPFMMLALCIVAALGPGLINVLIALMIANIPYYTRLVRSAILNIAGQDYIEAARSCNAPDYKIILKHVLPNAIGPIIITATMSTGNIILNASAMSFLGMGIQPPAPEWGSMLAESKDYMMYAPHIMIFPGIAIGLTALSLNLLGDGLRDALDPKLKD